MTNKKPLWEEPYTPWKSKSQYISWIRGGLRKLWSRHPSKTELRKATRKKLDNGKGRAVYHNQCAMCKEWKKTADTEVDHLKCNPPFRDLKDIQAYVQNLLGVGVGDLQILCKPCHKIKTYSERYGVSIEEARKRKAK